MTDTELLAIDPTNFSKADLDRFAEQLAWRQHRIERIKELVEIADAATNKKDCEDDKCPYCDAPARKDENCCYFCYECKNYLPYHEVEGWTYDDDGDLCPECSAKTGE